MTFRDWFVLLLIYIPLVMLWAFAFIDIFNRVDLSGWGKTAWLLAILVLPYLGTLLYLIFRPAGGGRPYAAHPDGAMPRAEPTAADQLRALAELHASGELSDEEFAAAKSRVLGIGAPVVPATSPSAATGV